MMQCVARWPVAAGIAARSCLSVRSPVSFRTASLGTPSLSGTATILATSSSSPTPPRLVLSPPTLAATPHPSSSSPFPSGISVALTTASASPSAALVRTAPPIGMLRTATASQVRGLVHRAAQPSAMPPTGGASISPNFNNPSFWQHASLFIRIAALAYVIQVYIANFTLSVGPSMQPTLNEYGDVLFTECITPQLGRLRNGDIVTAVKPTDKRVTVLKRIHAMPGDTVHVAPCQVGAYRKIDDAPQLDHHRDRHHDHCAVAVTVPKGHVWLQGDNSSQSVDSRHYGPVPLALVQAKAWCRVWPLSQITLFHSAAPSSSPSTSTSSSS